MAERNEEVEELLEREELQLASLRRRAFAAVIDEFLLTLIFMIILWDGFASASTTEELINLTNAFVLEFMAVKIIYQTFFVYQYGATVGKIMMKIQVLELRTLAAPSLISAFNRAVFRVISETIFYLGFLWGLMDPLRQTWHDRSARTVVVDA